MKKLLTLFVLTLLGTSAFSQTISWAYLQWEASATITEGQSFEAGAAVFAEGLTNNAIASTTGEGIICEIGYSSSNTDPSLTGWTWSSIPFNADWGNNFYYQGTLPGVPAGTYYYTFRFKLGADPYKYAGTNGLWNGTSSVNKSFTVIPATLSHVTWASLQWEASTTITQGQSFEAGAVAFADGLTNAVVSTTGEGMICEIGYSSSNTDPSLTGWTWSSVPFNADWGDNFYFQGSVSGMTQGTYFYTFRFKLGTDPYVYAGSNGIWNGTSSLNKSFTVNPTPSHVTWAYLQWEASTTITQGQSFEAGAVAFADGFTNALTSTTGDGMICEIGYSSSNTDPSSTGWTWSTVPFNADWGDNFYFQGTASGMLQGTYYYTFRFKLGTDSYVYAGTNGLWDGVGSVNKSFTVNPAPVHITWAYLQWESSTTITVGQSFEAGAVAFADGLTNAVASTTGEGMICEIGYSSSNTDPSSTGWTWTSVPFNADWGDNFYFQGTATGMVQGTYYYTFRFKLGTDSYVYAGTNGLWDGTNSLNKTFTVNPAPAHVTWAYLQWEASTTINEGQSFEAGAVAFADGLTNAIASTTGEGMICEIGYSISNTDPSSTVWTWSAIPFNADWGDNFYFQGSVSGVPAGTYFYTFRFKLGDDPYKYAGTNGLWDGTGSVNKSFTVNPVTGIISNESKTPSINVYPNPVSNGIINLTLNNMIAGEYKLIMVDIGGHLIQKTQLSCANGSNILDLPSKAVKGIYLLQVSSLDNTSKLTKKVVIE